MSVLVGDVIIKARNAFKDPCATLIPPNAPALSGTTGGSLTGTIYAQNTWLTQWGETLPSPEISIVLGANSAITDGGALVPPPGATAGRIYYGNASGSENQYAPVTMGGVTTILGPGTGARVPRLNRAYLPDTDGLVNAQQMYNWLNQALVKMGVITGGILDVADDARVQSFIKDALRDLLAKVDLSQSLGAILDTLTRDGRHQ